jgi:hypothetical protein
MAISSQEKNVPVIILTYLLSAKLETSPSLKI